MWLSHTCPKFLVSKTKVWPPQILLMFSWMRRQASLTTGKWELREEYYTTSTASWTLGITTSAFLPCGNNSKHKPKLCQRHQQRNI